MGTSAFESTHIKPGQTSSLRTRRWVWAALWRERVELGACVAGARLESEWEAATVPPGRGPPPPTEPCAAKRPWGEKEHAPCQRRSCAILSVSSTTRWLPPCHSATVGVRHDTNVATQSMAGPRQRVARPSKPADVAECPLGRDSSTVQPLAAHGQADACSPSEACLAVPPLFGALC